jgi:hypothetical protein
MHCGKAPPVFHEGFFAMQPIEKQQNKNEKTLHPDSGFPVCFIVILFGQDG